MAPPTTIVGLAGPSASGKTTLAKRVHHGMMKDFGADSIVVLSEDNYYRDQSHMSMEERKAVNYDDPSSLDHALLVQHLRELKAGRPVEVPVYDFVTSNRTANTTRVNPARVVLIEGILIFASPEVRELIDFRVYVETPLDICLMRRITRDMCERGRSLESIFAQYKKGVRPAFKAYVEPSKAYAHVLLSGKEDNELAVRMLEARLRELMSQTPHL